MSADEIGVKFVALGKDVLGESRCREIGRIVMKLEQEKTVDRLMTLMVR